MDQRIIKTKLAIPLSRDGAVSREELTALLSEGLACNRKVTLVSAPPGYGKTSLISEWAKKETARFAWLSLDKEDNEPVRFFSYLVSAFQQYDPNFGVAALSLLEAPQFPPADMLAGVLVNDAAELTERVVLVLDDFHHIQDGTILDTLQHLLENQPGNLHIAITTRQDPPIPVSKFRVRGQLTEIRKEKLRFSYPEAFAFLNETMNMQLKEEQVRLLETRTEGWVAGLQLAALSIRGKDGESLSRFLDDFNGTQKYILEYLFEEIFLQLPEETKEFLIQTSILERISSSLCDFLLDRCDGSLTIERILKSNLFLVPLDEFGQWYRFHALFRDSLLAQLDRERKKALHLKAAIWFEGNKLYEEAISQAILAEEFDMLERLLEKTSWSMIQNGEIRTLYSRIAALPAERVNRNSEIRMYLAWCLLLSGNGKEAARHMNEIDLTELVRYRPEIKANMLVLQIFKSVSFRELAPLNLPGQAAEFVQSSDPILRTSALYCMAQIASFRGDLEASVQYYHDAFTNAMEAGQYFMAVISAKNLSISQLLRNRKGDAVKICHMALEKLVDAKGRLLPAASILYVPLGMAYYTEDNLEKAYECFDKGITICRKLSLIHFAVQGEMSFALLKFAMKDEAGAFDTIRKAEQALGEIGMEIGIPMFTAIEAEMHLRKGDLAFAGKWVSEMGLDRSDLQGILDERQYFAYARILIAEGKNQKALMILKRLGDLAEAGDRMYRLISVYILTAVNDIKRNLPKLALESLKKAVELGAPEGCFRLFLDEDPCILPLLENVRDLSPEFIDTLLEKYGRMTGDALSGGPLNDQLSKRELEILKLVAAGLSNQEISDTLFISLGTTKWHITNILSKLGVKNRMQAMKAAEAILADRSSS